MQTICTSLQTDNHTNRPDALPDAQPTVSKHRRQNPSTRFGKILLTSKRSRYKLENSSQECRRPRSTQSPLPANFVELVGDFVGTRVVIVALGSKQVKSATVLCSHLVHQ